MNILCIGDMHLKMSNFETNLSFLSWIEEVVSLYKPDLIVNLGDTFNDHAVIRSELLSEFYKHVKQCTKNTPYIYVLGNHDFFKPNDSKYHALTTFKDVKNLSIIESYCEIDGISYSPYIPVSENFQLETKEILVCHQTFLGADFGDYRPDSGISLKDVSAEIIISGHIHKKQEFDKLIYPGTPFAQNVKDVNQDKGLMLFNTKTYDQKFIPSPFPRWKRVTFNLDEMDIPFIMEEMESFTEWDNWVVDMSGPKNEVLALLSNARFKKLQSLFKVKINTSYTDKQKMSNISIKKSSIKEIAHEYIDKVYNGQLDRTQLKKELEEIL